MSPALTVAMFSVALTVALSGANAAPTEPRDTLTEVPRAWPAEVAPELKQIQRALGGSVVEQFPQLDRPVGELLRRSPKGANPQAARGGRARGGAIEALRDAAAELDVAANKLERFELYEQADGLREQAQRLRRDARRMSGGERSERRVEPVLPTPQLESVPSPLQPKLAPSDE